MTDPITKLYNLMLEKHWDDEGLLNEIQAEKDELVRAFNKACCIIAQLTCDKDGFSDKYVEVIKKQLLALAKANCKSAPPNTADMHQVEAEDD